MPSVVKVTKQDITRVVNKAIAREVAPLRLTEGQRQGILHKTAVKPKKK